MDRWCLAAATLVALFGVVGGVRALMDGQRSRVTPYWMLGVFGFQFAFLVVRGEMRGACPLRDTGEILAFLAWALTLFYLIVGPAYRISLLGVFTAPLVVIFQSLALLPGMLDENPQQVIGMGPWSEIHSATSALAFGAFALAAVAAVMFLILDHQLKEHHLKGGLFRNLPPVPELLISLERLLWIGTVLLTIGIIAGLLMGPRGATGHFIAAIAIWLGFLLLVLVKTVRGITGRRFSLAVVTLWACSWMVFVFV